MKDQTNQAVQSLDEFVRLNQKFLKINSGDVFTGTYLGFQIVSSAFDPDKSVVQYKLAYEDGIEVTWQNASTKVAQGMSILKKGDKVSIGRTGGGMKDTRYKIDKK